MARRTFDEVEGTIHPAPAPRFSRTESAIASPPAPTGAHTEEALADWGFGSEELERLRASGAIA